MTRAALATAFELDVLFSTVCTFVLGIVWYRRERARAASREDAPRGRHAWAAQPLVQLALVCALLLLNQIFFNAYVLRMHGGDPSFVARYLPSGWCQLAIHHPVIQFVASRITNGRLFSLSVLRVQAFLELPFVIFAYLAIARMLSPRVYRALTALPVVALASISFSVALSLAELLLPNPWTQDDLALRVLSCILTPLYSAWLARRDSASEEKPLGVLGLLSFVAGAGAVAYIVLAAYDAFLLYNLGHLAGYAPALVFASVVAGLASVATPRLDGLADSVLSTLGASSPALESVHRALSVFTMLFFVPSLAIRYCGFHLSAQACGAFLVFIASAAGVQRLWQAAKLRSTGALLVGFAAGSVCAIHAFSTKAAIGELALARASVAFLVVSIVVARVLDGAHHSRREADDRLVDHGS